MPYYIKMTNIHKQNAMFAFAKANIISEFSEKKTNILLAKIHRDRVGQTEYLEAFFPAHRDFLIHNEKGYCLLSDGRKIFFDEDKVSPRDIDNCTVIFLHNPPSDIEMYNKRININDWVYVPWSQHDLDKFLEKHSDAKCIDPM